MTRSSLTTKLSLRAFGGNVDSSRGAHALELALAIFVIALIFLGMADFMRFLAVKTLATKGAQEGLALAERLSGIDTDLREKCRTIPAEDECQRFENARNLIHQRASLSATQVLAAPSTYRASSPQALVPAEYRMLGQPTTMTMSDAVFLRPGDTAEVQFGSRRKLLTNGRVPPDQSWATTLETQPMVVYVCFEVKSILPLLPRNLEGCSLASGYRYSSENSDTLIAPISVVTMTSTSTSTSSTTSTTTSTSTTTTTSSSSTSTSTSSSTSTTEWIEPETTTTTTETTTTTTTEPPSTSIPPSGCSMCYAEYCEDRSGNWFESCNRPLKGVQCKDNFIGRSDFRCCGGDCNKSCTYRNVCWWVGKSLICEWRWDC